MVMPSDNYKTTVKSVPSDSIYKQVTTDPTNKAEKRTTSLI
jgi:hypothetical protein